MFLLLILTTKLQPNFARAIPNIVITNQTLSVDLPPDGTLVNLPHQVQASTDWKEGYTLKVYLSQSSPDINIKISGGDITTPTILPTTAQSALTLKTTTTKNTTADDIDISYQLSTIGYPAAGDRQLIVTFMIIDNPDTLPPEANFSYNPAPPTTTSGPVTVTMTTDEPITQPSDPSWTVVNNTNNTQWTKTIYANTPATGVTFTITDQANRTSNVTYTASHIVSICRNADPNSQCDMEIDTSMIPIKYTGNVTTPEWRKANPNLLGDWYDYGNWQWANAAVVTADTRATYQAADPDTIIPEDDIIAYYVYIPRFKYQVCRPNATDPVQNLPSSAHYAHCPTDISAPYNFLIEFQKTNQRTGNYITNPNTDHTTYVLSTQSGQQLQAGDWITHPAFMFGTTNLAGIWVGKYEVNSEDTINTATAANDAITNGKVQIKPNQNGLNWTNLKTQFDVTQSFTNPAAPNYYGLSSATTNSRPTKNDDWGAITYLATSQYGRGTDSIHVNNCLKEKNDPNDDDWPNHNNRTGWATANPNAAYTLDCLVGYNDTGAYHTILGRKGSTTSNPTGVYDMSGGNWECQMANYHSVVSYGGFTSAFLTDSANAKYFNFYSNPPFTSTSDDDYLANNNVCTYASCIGQALHETKSVQVVTDWVDSWNIDTAAFPTPLLPWLIRGGSGHSGWTAGLFASSRSFGEVHHYQGWRALQSTF